MIPTPSFWQSVLVAVVIAALLSDAPRIRRLKQATSAAARLSAFRSTTVCLWSAALLALFLAWPHDLFAVPTTGNAMGWLLGSPAMSTGATVLTALYFAAGLGPGIHCMLQSAVRPKYRAALLSLEYMLPVSSHERRWWVAVSISAGVCEEVFFRSFLPQFLTGQLHGSWTLDPTVAWLVSAVAFGMCHFYQGVGGIVRTTIGALLLSLAAILSGSILLPVVLHLLLDLAILPLYRPLLDNPAKAARPVTGET
ncbi:CPBP family intramembrane metalloprotease [Massilia sp. DJPM01]|uniref:CPBP family intramembrane glutamic endopeptidase n=1 Tax=Massilia sp. DJPM01 TaxID=3024404 RepID=UPI00259E9121|nr:CPBP family intramembrane glutamic endopeptidase [Massilia sp. DJPM01]MDM5182101.1 CPBP family intramembrane metalloprotease [Massilia sp. DJPM01]